MRLVFIEDRAEAEVLLRDAPLPHDAQVIAIGLDARVALRSEGIACTGTLPHVSTDSHVAMITHADQVLGRLRGWTLVDADLPIDTYADTTRYYLRQYITHFAWLLEIIARACSKEHADQLVACAGTVPPPASPAIGDMEHYLGSLSEAFAAAHGIRFAGLPAVVEPMPTPAAATASWVATLARGLTEMMLTIDPREKVLVASPAYGMAALTGTLAAELPDVTWVTFDEHDTVTAHGALSRLIGAALSRRRRRVTIPLRGIPRLSGRSEQEFRLAVRSALMDALRAIRPGCRYAGVDYGGLLERKVTGSLEPFLVTLKQCAAYFDHLIGAWNVKVVLGQFGVREQHALLAVARQRNRDAVMIPHGAVIIPDGPAARAETRELRLVPAAATAVVAQSPSTLESLAALQSPQRVAAAGPALWPPSDPQTRERVRARLGIPPDAFVIVHASTQKSRKVHRFFTHETPDEYVVAIADLIAAAETLRPDAYVLVKLHPAGTPGRDALRQWLGPHDRVRVISGGPFAEALAAADVLVSYSSTTVHEALYARTPVILYDPWERYRHLPAATIAGAAPAMRAAVYYVPSRQDLSTALEWVRTAHPPALPLTVDELAPYVFADAPPVARQIATFIRTILAAERTEPAPLHKARHPE